MTLRPLKLEYERDDLCRCGLPSDSPEHDPSSGGNHAFEEEKREFVTLRGVKISTANVRELFEGSINYAVIDCKDETLEEVNKLLEIALAIGWAFVSASADFETLGGQGFAAKLVLFFKWIGD